MTFQLPALPYDYNALEPYMSAQTLEFHHDKHHATYVTTLNKLIQDTELAGHSLESIIQTTSNDPSKTNVFNNAAQVWNHTFFWDSMKPGGGQHPTGILAEKITADFGSFDQFKEMFKSIGVTQFGSGYAWLVLENNMLKVIKTANAVNPLTQGQVPLLATDVWEHAYYLDYQNRRPDYLQAFLDHLANWDFATENYVAARKLQLQFT